MKRKLAWIMVLLLTVLAVTGCGNNGLADYKAAVEKTDQIVKGQDSGEFSLTMDFNTEGMSQEAINELNYYKDLSGSFQSSFDTEQDQGIIRNYLNLGGLGFDFSIYHNREELFVKLPIVGKYMRMDDLLEEADQTVEVKTDMISDETKAALSAEWVGILNEEDVFKGKDIVLTTPDGEVKTTVYTITLTDSQVKALAGKTIDILAEEESLKSSFVTMVKSRADHPEEINFDFDETLATMKEQILRDTIEEFQYTAYVDIDGYIVNETIEVRIKRDAITLGEPETISFQMELKNWDINRDQNLEFPVLTEENTMKSGELSDTMPSLFQDLFQTQ